MGGGEELGERLAGGNVGGAWRIGDTVRRPVGPWSPAVHALLQHLDGRLHAPRFLGVDGLGREILDFLPGTIVDVDHTELSDRQLGALASWARGLHLATVEFSHPGPWRFPPHPEATVIGHGDLAPYNVCFDGDELVGVFDWDLAGPTTPLFEIGFLAWNGVPLYRTAAGEDPDRWAADRLGVIAAGYGGLDPVDILHATVERTEATISGMLAAAAAGDEGMRRLMETTGEPAPTREALIRLRRRIPAIEAALLA